MKKKVAIYIGRFQPLHIAHEKIIKYCLQNYDHTIVIVGSVNKRRSIKNPFDYFDIKKWIIGNIDSNNITVLPVKDYIYNEQKWIASVEEAVYSVFLGRDVEYYIVGHNKDETSYYLREFPNFKVEELPSFFNGISATDIREKIFREDKSFLNYLPEYVASYILEFMKTEQYKVLQDEFYYYENEKKLFENYPYPETLKFNTADAVVVCDGNILLIKRKNNPGKGVWALPGGFVNRNETYEECALRELREETGLKIPKLSLKNLIKGSKIFDSPNRNIGIPRITNAFYIEVFPDLNKKGYNKLPRVKPSSDAIEAKWFPLAMVKRMKLYDDHFDIISYFTGI